MNTMDILGKVKVPVANAGMTPRALSMCGVREHIQPQPAQYTPPSIIQLYREKQTKQMLIKQSGLSRLQQALKKWWLLLTSPLCGPE